MPKYRHCPECGACGGPLCRWRFITDSPVECSFECEDGYSLRGGAAASVVACASDAEALKKVLNDSEILPPENYEILAVLVPFLLQVTRHAEINRMTAKALSICWSQSLMRTPVDDESDPQEAMLKIAMDTAKCNAVVETMIANAAEIFDARPSFSWV